MKDPTRLLHASASELEQQLLRAGAAEQPPSAAMQRLAEQLGVRVAAGDTARLSAPTVTATKLPLTAASKALLAFGVVVMGVTLAATFWLSTREPNPAATHEAPRDLAEGDRATARPADVRPVAPAVHPHEVHNDTAAAHPNLRAERAAAPGSVRAPATPKHSLPVEIARIDAVRRHLAADRTKPALAALRAYQRDFPGGVLRQEATLLTIEAHRQAGDHRRARTLAARFLASNPDSPHSARVRDLLESQGSDAR